LCCFYACILSSNEDLEDSYPTIIYSLSDDELAELQSEFDLLNNNKIDTRLDQFGYTGFTADYRASEKNISDSSTVIQMANSALVKNVKFTNILNTSMLRVDRFFKTPNGSWKIFFNEQVYKGLRIDGTTIVVYLNSDGVYRIDNHFYKDIYVPGKAELSESEAKESLIGKEIGLMGHYFTITNSVFSDKKTQRAIIPVHTDTTIEFRIAWEIYIGEPGCDWTIYVDIITGEEIKIVQNFMT